MPQHAVLDACVLVPIALCDVLLELAESALFEPLWSDAILAETEKALIEKRGVPADRAAYRVELMRSALPKAMVSGFDELIPQMLNNPKDRHVLAAAVRAGCSVVVTDNISDFPAKALAPHGVKAIRPDDFLLQLLDDDEDAVWSAIERKRATYKRPPRTMEQFCDLLGKLVPKFAARLLEVHEARSHMS